jgi:hypothetical protein
MPSKWSGVVLPPGKPHGGLTLDPDQPDLEALVKFARNQH